MKNQYITYDEITKEILDTVKIGDLVKCNDWKVPLKVKGVSINYIIMSSKRFGKCLYSICEKKQVNHNRNNYTEGNYRIGTDNYVFGLFDYLNEDDVEKALKKLEAGDLELSVRTSVNLERINIKSAVA